MIRCVEFEKLIGKGASRPFLARDDQGDVWVIKPHTNAHEKPLFNEYVAGSLARHLGLPWPDVRIVQLVPDVIRELKEKGIHISSEWGVGLGYVAGLEPYVPPHDSKENAAHMNHLFPHRKTHAVFYGKSVFDNWTLLEDWKYDTLQIQPDGSPLFLDASMAFGGSEFDGSEWNMDRLKWSLFGIHFERSPYLRGFLSDLALFESWLRKVEGVQSEVFAQILHSIPEEWSVPTDYLAAVNDFLTATLEQFLPLFREEIEWEKESLFKG